MARYLSKKKRERERGNERDVTICANNKNFNTKMNNMQTDDIKYKTTNWMH